MNSVVLLVTWFYYGQPPVTSQTQFASTAACEAARVLIFQDAYRLKIDAERDVAQKRAQGIIYNAVIPTVSAVCAAQ
jgi:hypothetical protein